MIKTIVKEVKKIDVFPSFMIDYMSLKNNWIIVDSDCALGEGALFSYPDNIYVLSIKNASDEVLKFLNSFKNNLRTDFVISHETLELEEEISDEDYENMMSYCIFAYHYNEINEEGINDQFFENRDQVYIFNGLDFNIEDLEKEADNALNVKGYEVF